jgi:hypothetical protein
LGVTVSKHFSHYIPSRELKSDKQIKKTKGDEGRDAILVDILSFATSLLLHRSTWRGTHVVTVPCSEEARHWVDGANVEVLVVEIAEEL